MGAAGIRDSCLLAHGEELQGNETVSVNRLKYPQIARGRIV